MKRRWPQQRVQSYEWLQADETSVAQGLSRDLEDASARRVVAPITLTIGPWRDIEIDPGTLVSARSRTYLDDGPWGWYPSWITTTSIRVLDGRHAGSIGFYTTQDGWVANSLEDSFPPEALEPIEPESVAERQGTEAAAT